jgi:hypothetical protein
MRYPNLPTPPAFHHNISPLPSTYLSNTPLGPRRHIVVCLINNQAMKIFLLAQPTRKTIFVHALKTQIIHNCNWTNTESLRSAICHSRTCLKQTFPVYFAPESWWEEELGLKNITSYPTLLTNFTITLLHIFYLLIPKKFTYTVESQAQFKCEVIHRNVVRSLDDGYRSQIRPHFTGFALMFYIIRTKRSKSFLHSYPGKITTRISTYIMSSNQPNCTAFIGLRILSPNKWISRLTTWINNDTLVRF